MTEFNKEQVEQHLTDLLEDCSERALSHKEFIRLSVGLISNYLKNQINKQRNEQRNEHSKCGQCHTEYIKESG